ncbi:MAG TPA: LysM peptidoglycan-binding domain-containing protein [Sporichthya sp.]|nr:LysM peptidoglycan-binding domain-containing protein [Sporichthya sp.]
MNTTAGSGTSRLTLVRTPSVAELERMVAGTPAPTAAPLRLTRRGRLAVVALFLATLFAGGVLFGSTATRATGEPGAPQDYQYLVVQPGQTLWGIAKEIAPQKDPRATIEAIRRLNALPDTGVEAGQRIALP